MTYAALALVVAVIGLGFVAAPVAYLLYPVTTLLAALLLLWRKPGGYVAFVWAVWFITPFVRRVVDLDIGYTEASIVMLAPFVVTGIAIFAVIPRLHELPKTLRVPLGLVVLGLAYAYLVGVLYNGLVGATFDLLNWGAPVVGALYMLTHWREMGVLEPSLRRTFGMGLILMSLYGMWQFFAPNPWDSYWMEQALLNDGLNSIGTPEPYEVRVFSTMNAPGPFAVTLMVGLLLLFGGPLGFWWLAFALGVVAFALSLVRSAWGGWVLGLLFFIARLPKAMQLRYLSFMVIVTLIGVPIISLGPMGEVLGERFSTLGDIQEDTSFNDRLSLYGDIGEFVVGNPLGRGLGSTGVGADLSTGEALQDLDSGIIAVVFTFGALGTLYFAAGALFLFGVSVVKGFLSTNRFAVACSAVTLACGSQLLFGNSWTGVSGMGLWFFAACGLASIVYQAEHNAAAAFAEPGAQPVVVAKGYRQLGGSASD